MKKNFFCFLILVFSLAAGCNRVPSDMFPKSVGSFQMKGKPDAYKDKSGLGIYSVKYESADNKLVYCSGSDYSSLDEAIVYVKQSDDFVADATAKPQPGKTASWIILGAYAGAFPATEEIRPYAVRWNNGVRAYNCTMEDKPETAEKILSEFQKNFQ